MVAISITAQAYRAIKATLPQGAKPYRAQSDERSGGFRIWLDRATLDHLTALRAAGETTATSSFAWRRMAHSAREPGIDRRYRSRRGQWAAAPNNPCPSNSANIVAWGLFTYALMSIDAAPSESAL
jgi:hypothetical protein